MGDKKYITWISIGWILRLLDIFATCYGANSIHFKGSLI